MPTAAGGPTKTNRPEAGRERKRRSTETSGTRYGTGVSAPFENVDFRRNGVSFLTGQHTGVIQP